MKLKWTRTFVFFLILLFFLGVDIGNLFSNIQEAHKLTPPAAAVEGDTMNDAPNTLGDRVRAYAAEMIISIVLLAVDLNLVYLHMCFDSWITLLLVQFLNISLFWNRFLWDIIMVAVSMKHGWNLDAWPTMDFVGFDLIITSGMWIKAYSVVLLYFSLSLTCKYEDEEMYLLNAFARGGMKCIEKLRNKSAVKVVKNTYEEVTEE